MKIFDLLVSCYFISYFRRPCLEMAGLDLSSVASPSLTITWFLLQILQELGPDAKEGQFPGRNMWMGHDSLNNYSDPGLTGAKRKNVSANTDNCSSLLAKVSNSSSLLLLHGSLCL